MNILEKSSSASYLRNFVLGVEDSLVSTVGFLSGIAAVNTSSMTIILTGIVLIFVEAFSMAAGSFLSEYSAEGYLKRLKRPFQQALLASITMFFSYFIFGFIPLAPYIFAPDNLAFSLSILLSLIALFALGIISAQISKINRWRSVARTLLVGSIAIGIGIAVGKWIETFRLT